MLSTLEASQTTHSPEISKLLRVAEKPVVIDGVTIRRANLDDFRVIKDYLMDFNLLHKKNEPGLLDDSFPTLRYIYGYYKQALRCRDSFFMVAEVDGKIAGFTKLDLETLPEIFKDNEILYIDTLYVAPQFRGAGVGGALLLHAEEIAKQKGRKRVQMSIYAFNAPMQKLVRSKGYRLPHATWDKVLA